MDRRRASIAALWALTLVVSFVLYRAEHALEHFVWHLSYGGAFGLLLGAAWMVWTDRPARHPTVWAWAGYVFMIVPDLIWIAPRLGGSTVHPHQPWMDVFLGHVFLDTWAWTNVVLVPTGLLAVGAWWWAWRRVAGPARPTGAPPQG